MNMSSSAASTKQNVTRFMKAKMWLIKGGCVSDEVTGDD